MRTQQYPPADNDVILCDACYVLLCYFCWVQQVAAATAAGGRETMGEIEKI
jgi:hypothetical protein